MIQMTLIYLYEKKHYIFRFEMHINFIKTKKRKFLQKKVAWNDIIYVILMEFKGHFERNVDSK